MKSVASSTEPIVRYPKNSCPPDVIELVTDILADLVLEDVKKYPQLPIQPIDSFDGQGNTTVQIPEGKA
jgi:hypothetical protein